ncbi:MAG: hypothetical protein WC843_02485 [Candidatus Gracilibacteria bacterium]|jgi:hypothetical protein
MQESASEQLESKSITVQDIRSMDERVVAVLWQNFLKRLANEAPEDQAKKLLFHELVQEWKAGNAYKNPPIVDDQPGASVEELIYYFRDGLYPNESYLVQNRILSPVQDDVTDEHGRTFKVGQKVTYVGYGQETPSSLARISLITKGRIQAISLAEGRTKKRIFSGNRHDFLDYGESSSRGIIPRPTDEIKL